MIGVSLVNHLSYFLFLFLKETAEARLQVIAQDLDQAQSTADYLSGLLDQRDQHLQHELKNADMNNQMISKLYPLVIDNC